MYAAAWLLAQFIAFSLPLLLRQSRDVFASAKHHQQQQMPKTMSTANCVLNCVPLRERLYNFHFAHMKYFAPVSLSSTAMSHVSQAHTQIAHMLGIRGSTVNFNNNICKE